MTQFILIRKLRNPQHLPVGSIIEWDTLLKVFLTLDGQYFFTFKEVNKTKSWNMLKYYQFEKSLSVLPDFPPVVVVTTPINDLDPLKPGSTVLTDQGILKKVEYGAKYSSYTHTKVIQMWNVSPKHYNTEKFLFITPERYGELIKPKTWTTS